MRFTRHATLLAVIVTAVLSASARAQTPGGDPPGTPAATPPAGGEQPPAGGAVVATTTEAAPPNVRLRRLEQKVQALKEQAWRVKARVGMLKEAVIGGGIGARAVIQHDNKMGGSFRLIKLVYALDGAQVFAKSDDSSKLHDIKKLDVLSGPIAPGNHTISVLMVYQGNGYGVFAYLKKYKFTVRLSHTFTASEGKQTSVTVVGYERGGVTTPLEKRPAVDFRVNVVAERPGEGKK